MADGKTFLTAGTWLSRQETKQLSIHTHQQLKYVVF